MKNCYFKVENNLELALAIIERLKDLDVDIVSTINEDTNYIFVYNNFAAGYCELFKNDWQEKCELATLNDLYQQQHIIHLDDKIYTNVNHDFYIPILELLK